MIEYENLLVEGRTRVDILNAAYSAGKSGAHIAPSLSVVEICLAILDGFDEIEDSFILSKGHGALGYYAAMHQSGLISNEQFLSFEQNGGEFSGQPSKGKDNKIKYSSGSLGMGLCYGLGVAIGKKKSGGRVFVVVGDGELNEGSNWEAVALANKYGLDNMIVIVDNNELQSDGKCEDIMCQNLSAIWKAYGWHLVIVDGHSIEELKQGINCIHDGRPLVILARTVKGKGISFMENNNAWHHAALNDKDYRNAIQEVGGRYGLY